jgi:hypothetical protein
MTTNPVSHVIIFFFWMDLLVSRTHKASLGRRFGSFKHLGMKGIGSLVIENCYTFSPGKLLRISSLLTSSTQECWFPDGPLELHGSCLSSHQT